MIELHLKIFKLTVDLVINVPKKVKPNAEESKETDRT